MAGASTLVIGGYFILASAVTRMTFFGTQLTPAEQARANALTLWFVLTVFVGTPIAVIVARRVVGSVERRRAADAAGCAWQLALCGPVGLVAALFVSQLLPSGARTLAFGILWLAMSVVALPLLVSASYRRRTHPVA